MSNQKLITQRLQLDNLLGQNITILETPNTAKTVSLCDSCIRSAAPPSLQCIWDKSKANVLPDGAEISLSKTRNEKKDMLILAKVRSCPMYLDINQPDNKTLLQEERRKNVQQETENITAFWRSLTNHKSQNHDDWR